MRQSAEYLKFSRITRWFLVLLLVIVNCASTPTKTAQASCSPAATTGDDTIICTTANDTIDGLAGNDSINGGGGNDTITGNSGDDTLIGGTGNDTYRFDTDAVLGTDSVTEASGGGTDTLNFSGSTNDLIVNLGTTGNQTINGNLTLNLTAAQVENVTGGDGNDQLTGNTLSNSITGGAGNDVLTGGTGNDTYYFNTNTNLEIDTVTEATSGGTDALNFSGSNNTVIVNLGTTGNQFVNGNLTLNLTAAQVENLTGGNGGDNLTGNALANAISGGNGNDTLDGGAGNNSLTGGAGDDSLTGGTGNDTYNFDTDTSLGVDSITEASGGGTDALSFNGSTNTVVVNLGTLGNQIVNSNLTINLTAAQVENLTGGSGNDTLTGNSSNNSISGGSGNDILDGGAGNDTLTGGAGNDLLLGGTGNDTYSFDTDSALGVDEITEAVGGGTDTLNFSTSSNNMSVDLSLIGNQVVNTNLTLNLTSSQVENLTGGTGNDTLNGNSLNNTISGGNGNDSLNGGDGNDTLDGGAGNDTINGGNGNDTLTAGTGIDTLDGGAGDDIITISGANVTGDSFTGGTGNNTFRFSSGTSGILQLISNGTDTLDFSLFGVAISIDLGNASPQNVTAGLQLTLVGLFENVIGTTLNDWIIGNNGDNVLTGGNGNDTLNGGTGGTDQLDGGAGIDTVQNYDPTDSRS